MSDALLLLVQICVILLAARLTGRLGRRVHQPQVLGEIGAGLLLGPSLLGWLAPHLSALLFPAHSLAVLNAPSQLGLLLYMFLIGLELDLAKVHERQAGTLLISAVSIIVPFLLGVLLARYLYPRLSDPRVPMLHFTLFVGTAMSITAFPVLARILTEQNLVQTAIGSLAIACAAVNDVVAWCLLATLVGLVQATTGTVSLGFLLLGGAAYGAVLLLGVRRLLRRVVAVYQRHHEVTQDILALILIVMFASAAVTEWLGLHALFGAFLVGALVPNDRGFVRALVEKIEGVTVVVLLPLFFVITGLRTSIGLLNDRHLWLLWALLTAVAIVSKVGGVALAAHMSGTAWREATSLGVLMNTRGLVELVVLNVGLEVGVISPTVFAMLVLMALVTTLMTTPLLEWVYLAPRRRAALPTVEHAPAG